MSFEQLRQPIRSFNGKNWAIVEIFIDFLSDVSLPQHLEGILMILSFFMLFLKRKNPIYAIGRENKNIIAYRMELDTTRSWNSDQNCTQHSARGWLGVGWVWCLMTV